MFLRDYQKTALIWLDDEISYSELLSRISFFSSLIPRQKISKIAIFSENRPENVYSIYASWYNGAIPVLFDYTADSDEILCILNETKPAVIFGSKDYENKIKDISKRLAFKAVIIIYDNLQPATYNRKIEEINPPNKDDTALIVYTSGTTGLPRGAMLSFNNLLANINAIVDG